MFAFQTTVNARARSCMHVLALARRHVEAEASVGQKPWASFCTWPCVLLSLPEGMLRQKPLWGISPWTDFRTLAPSILSPVLVVMAHC